MERKKPGLLADLDVADALPSPNFPREDLQNFNPDVSIGGPLFVSATVAAYGISREEGLERLEELVRERAAEANGGKFNKPDALYSPAAPPPGAWDYRCTNCRFFQAGAGEGGGGLCELVGHEADPFGGESINPEAWCSLWMPLEDTPYLTYLKNRFEGEDG